MPSRAWARNLLLARNKPEPVPNPTSNLLFNTFKDFGDIENTFTHRKDEVFSCLDLSAAGGDENSDDIHDFLKK